MPEEKETRGQASNDTKLNNDEKSFEFNSFHSNESYELNNFLFNCGTYNYFDKNIITNIFSNPVDYHEDSIQLSNFLYTKNGIISNAIDYMTSIPCLDKIVTCKKQKDTKKAKQNIDLMYATLRTICDKKFIRDALHTEMREGTAFYYFDTKNKNNTLSKYMNDYDVQNIYEINEVGINAAILTLPWRYTKIIGKKNGRYVLAFDLKYFDEFTGTVLENKLKKYPTEIVNGYYKRQKHLLKGDWIVLDNDKTMCGKIKCKDSEPWGRSLILSSIEDVLYKDYFIDTKRNVLDEVNNKVIYQTFPEADKKGTCALNKNQQQQQHNDVRTAIMNKNSRGGLSFISLAAGTKLDSIDVNTDIFDSKNESELHNNISMDLGICASLIGATSTGNFASSQHNLELITAQLYTWVYEWQEELNYVINKNVIKDNNNRVDIYYFPTSFVNRQSTFDMMRNLYTEAGGSLKFLIASTGIDVEAYLSVLDQEIEDGIFEKYQPHKTSFTLSKSDQKPGRPSIDNPSNPNTIANKSNNGNNIPSPSDFK